VRVESTKERPFDIPVPTGEPTETHGGAPRVRTKAGVRRADVWAAVALAGALAVPFVVAVFR
jgi:hypothetical protein